MKNKLVLIAIGGSLLLAAPALRAEDAKTPPPHREHKEGPKAAPGEHLLPQNIVEKLNLTEDQKTKIKGIEESFAKTRKEYMDAHKAETDSARTAMKEAKESGDKAKMAAARQQMQQAMAGLDSQRKSAIDQVKSLLTDEQKKVLEDAKKNMMEHHGPKKEAAPAAK